ncbi:MAG: FGGY family carbohydrate kinase [Pseudomonadota bacterium]
MSDAVLALDQGTTNSKAILIERDGKILASGTAPVGITHPRPGWVEQDATDIIASQMAAIKTCLANAPDVSIAAIGISNQRESVVAWERSTGAPLGPVISWQCRRTADVCAALQAAGHSEAVLAKTGLPLDPMFPATKLAWLLKHAGRSDICLGTIDAWLIFALTGGAVHATDGANAARTQLLNLKTAAWDEDLADLFGVPLAALPEVKNSSGIFGKTAIEGLPAGIPITAAIGDSHAALFAQGAFRPGDAKVTFGTGSSVMSTIEAFAPPPEGLTTTIAWMLDGTATYAFEGNILVSAAIFPWTADLLGLPDVAALMDLAATVEDAGGVSLVPAHLGLGAPHWSTTAKGAIEGLSFGTKPAHIARAAQDSMALQVHDIFAAMGQAPARVFVDGGPTRNAALMAIVAATLDHPIKIRDVAEASALGAGYLAGLATGFFESREAIANLLPAAQTVAPEKMPGRDEMVANWNAAIGRLLAG